MTIFDQKQSFLDRLIEEQNNQEGSVFSKKAFDHFLEIGLPDKKSTSYEYFPLAKLYEKKLEHESSIISKQDIMDKVLPECLGSYLVLYNGVLSWELSDISRISKGIIVDMLEKNTSAYMPFIHAKLIQRQKKELDPFVLYCQAALKGLLIMIKEGYQLEAPVQIISYFDTKQCLPLANIYMHVGQNASCEVIHTHVHKGQGQSTSFVDVDIDQKGSCVFTRFNTDSLSMALDTMRVHLKKQASVSVYDINRPQAASKFHLHTIHHQKDSQSTFHALGLIEEKNEYHVSTNFEHIAREASSSQQIKTVLFSKAKASFEGQIYVHKEAILTQSYQKHASLMLGESGMVNSKPNLRIFADDVKASHGATIAELDQDALFYLKTRGLDETTAKKLLLDGFCLQIVENLKLDSLKEEVGLLLAGIDDL